MIKPVSARRYIFFLTTWGYLLTNLMVAWFASLNLPLLAIRESWMLVLLVLLFLNRSYFSLFLLVWVGLLGGAPFVMGFDIQSFLGFIYGFRDIFLLVLLIELASYDSDLDVTRKEVNHFVYFVIFIAAIDVVTTNILKMNIVESLFKASEYYSNKGVAINLSNGLLGDRIGSPLYSPNLLCTLLAYCFFFDKRISESGVTIRVIAFSIAVFTMTKVIVLSVLLYLLGRKWKVALLFGLTSLFPFYVFLTGLYESLDVSVMKYHLASLLGHLHAFGMSLENDLLSAVPEPLGSHSIAMQVRTEGTDSGAGIESVLLARASELKIYFLLVMVYAGYSIIKLKGDCERKFISFFIILSLLTATSNQPVAFIPALFLLKARE